ncbi:hypothetical protein KEM60_00403 [Austwickia sp. TVS 96-490-7B]|uniref:hypothetical protein n=1 Tax=Austwickia sp. TVS 96-490-7B TaxID=2830843 RepID=UPI001C56C4B1|nr:hypothetical protein [Austwickia sp. TVS 96-490-7B]MBW3084217.1 hypothetical protein [Austwickia sp. TVS 96-490-7B]
MYAALWRCLPGPLIVRLLICLVLFAGFVAACFTWLFPWVAEHLPVNDPSVGAFAIDPTFLP